MQCFQFDSATCQGTVRPTNIMEVPKLCDKKLRSTPELLCSDLHMWHMFPYPEESFTLHSAPTTKLRLGDSKPNFI